MWIPKSGLGTMFGMGITLIAKDDEEGDEKDGMDMGDFGQFFASSLILNEKWKYLPGVTITTSYGEGTRTIVAESDSRPDSTA